MYRSIETPSTLLSDYKPTGTIASPLFSGSNAAKEAAHLRHSTMVQKKKL